MNEIAYIGLIKNDIKILKAKSIFIYGAGKIGLQTFEYLKKAGMVDEVVGFIDNNPSIQGKKISEKPVMSLELAVKICQDSDYIVASMAVQEMTESLIFFGICKNKIHIIRETANE